MRAIVLREFGPASNLIEERVDDPVAGAGQVRVAVRATPVHLLEARLRAGIRLGPHDLPPLPHRPGGSVAGVVESVGPGVDEGWVGARVAADVEAGGNAELAVVATERLVRLPEAVGFAEATVMLSTGPTTLAILGLAELRSSDVVLVTAAAGAIGGLLTQRARAAGATVIGLASGSKPVSADLVVDYTRPDWSKRVADRGVTVVLEGVGGATAEAALELLVPGGRAVSFGAASGEFAATDRADITHRSLFESEWMAVFADPDGHRELVTRSLTALAEGDFAPTVQTFPLAKVAAAHEALENRRNRGQVVLVC